MHSPLLNKQDGSAGAAGGEKSGAQKSDDVAVPTQHTFLGFSRTSTFGFFGGDPDDDYFGRGLTEALGK